MLSVSPEAAKIPLGNKVYRADEVDQPAAHRYGEYGVRQLSRKIWKYPAEARQKRLEGIVYIQLRIEKRDTTYGKIYSDIGGGCGEDSPAHCAERDLALESGPY